MASNNRSSQWSSFYRLQSDTERIYVEASGEYARAMNRIQATRANPNISYGDLVSGCLINHDLQRLNAANIVADEMKWAREQLSWLGIEARLMKDKGKSPYDIVSAGALVRHFGRLSLYGWQAQLRMGLRDLRERARRILL